MGWDLLSVVLGLGVLVLAGDALVRGAAAISLRLGIPAAIVGMTVVAFGTSAPELIVSVQAVLRDAPALALGNVVGSNIANVLLVLGLPALFVAVQVSGESARRDARIMLGASVLFVGLALLGPIGWQHALVLLAGLGWMLWDAVARAQVHRNGNGVVELELPDGADAPWSRILAVTVLGLIGLPLGADLLVDGSVAIARDIGVSEAVIGLTLVAVGTSLPELATTLMAAIRREGGVALGNVLGSNCFNLLGIMGVAGLFGTLPVPTEMLVRDLWVMLGTAVLLTAIIYAGRPIRFWIGAGLVALYAGYLTLLALGIGG